MRGDGAHAIAFGLAFCGSGQVCHGMFCFHADFRITEQFRSPVILVERLDGNIEAGYHSLDVMPQPANLPVLAVAAPAPVSRAATAPTSVPQAALAAPQPAPVASKPAPVAVPTPRPRR